MKIADSLASVLQGKPSDLWHVGPDEIVFDAIQLMSDKNVGSLLVMRGKKLVGIFSERDYTRNVILKGRSSKKTSVHEIMTVEPVTVAPGATVEECFQIMTDRRVRHLPVLDGNEVVGIVSIGDLVKWIISAQSAMIDQLESYITGSYPS